MSEIIFPSEVLPEIDWENPLNDGLQTRIVSNGTDVVDLITGEIGTKVGSGTVTHGIGTGGRYFELNGNVEIIFSDGTIITPPESGGFTVVHYTEDIENPNDVFQPLVTFGTSGTPSWITLAKQYGAVDFKAFLVGGSTGYATSPYPNSLDGNLFTVVVDNDSDVTFYHNQDSADKVVSGAVNPQTNKDLSIGGFQGNTIHRVTGKFYFIDIFDKVLEREEVLEIHRNPYQLFKTKEKVEQEYGLVSEDTTQYITIVESTNKSTNYILEVSYILHEDNTGEVSPIPQVGGVAKLAMDYNQNLVFDATWSSQIFTSSHLQPRNKGEWVIRIECVAGTVNAYINGEILAETLTGAQGFRLPANLLKFSKKTGVKYLKFLTTDHPQDSRYWDFNQTHGDTVIDHINGAIATLVGFPADSGYVRGATGEISYYEANANVYAEIDSTNWKPNKVRYTAYIVARDNMGSVFINPHPYNNARGYYITKTGVRLTVTTNSYAYAYFNFASSLVSGQEYKVTIEAEYDTNVFRVFLEDTQVGSDYQSAYSGERPRLNFIRLWGYTHISSGTGKYSTKRVVLEDMSGALPTIDLDCTAGGSNKIIDAVGNNDAALVPSSTTKWQPITPVDVYTVGSGKDYPLIKNFFDSVKHNANTQRAIIHESDTGTNTIYVNGTCPRFELEAAKGKEFDITNTPPINYMQRRIYNYNTYIHIEGIGINLFNGVGFSCKNTYIQVDVQAGYGAGNWEIDDSLVHSLFCNTADNRVTNIRNSIFEEGGVTTYGTSNSNSLELNLYNCVVPNNHTVNSQNIGPYTSGGTKTNIYNSTMNHSGNGYTDGGGNFFGVDFTGAFVDSANGDYRINQAWADTNLVGKGWNGSDIASWAYFEEVLTGLTNITKDFNLVMDAVSRTSKDFTMVSDLLESSSRSFSMLVDLLNSLQVSKDFHLSVDFLQTTTKDFQTICDLSVGVQKAFNLLANLNQKVTKNFNSSTDLFQSGVKDFKVQTEFLEQQTYSFESVTDLYERRIQEFVAKVNLLQRETFEFILNSNFRVSSEKSFTFRTDLLSSMSASKDFNMVVDLQQRMNKAFALELDLLSKVSKDYDMVATILNQVTMDFVSRFDLLSSNSREFTVSVDFIERIGLTFNMVVRVDSDTIATTPAHYTIGLHQGVSFDSPELFITFENTKVKQVII